MLVRVFADWVGNKMYVIYTVNGQIALCGFVNLLFLFKQRNKSGGRRSFHKTLKILMKIQ